MDVDRELERKLRYCLWIGATIQHAGITFTRPHKYRISVVYRNFTQSYEARDYASAVQKTIDAIRNGVHIKLQGAPTVKRQRQRRQRMLTDNDIRNIQQRLAYGGVTQRELAEEYGVSRMTIYKCIHKWKDV